MQIQYLLGMAMELRHLRYVIVVAEEEHITRAAERLGMQQPPLSRQIKAIEREIDVQLFHRTPRGVELTDAGRAFVDGARSMLTALDHTVDSARRAARGEQGRISLGYTSGTAFHPLVQSTIREFSDAFPLVSVTLAEGFPHDLVEHMRNDSIDAAFIRTPVAGPNDIVIDSLLKEAMVVALPHRHPLASRKGGGDSALPLRALANESFIVFGRSQGPLPLQTSTIISACQVAGFDPHVAHLVPHHLSTLNLVAAGRGIAVVSASVQRIHIEGVVYRRLKSDPKLRIPLNLISRRGDTSAVVRQFLKLARQAARTFRA